jgi:hypothetical protein
MPKPRTFSSPRAARKFIEANAVEVYGEQIDKAIREGNRVLGVPRGAAKAIAEALNAPSGDGPGWGVVVGDHPSDRNMLQLTLIDPEDVAQAQAAPAGPLDPSTVLPNGMTAGEVAASALRGPEDPPEPAPAAN